MRLFLLAASITATSLMQAEHVDVNPLGPWFTGPLLTPSARTIPPGHFNFEPYLFIDNTLGAFNNHWHAHKASETSSNINFVFVTQIGLNHFMDLTIDPQFFYNYEGMQSSWRFGDLYMETGFQLARENRITGMPVIKFAIGELFPTGVYQHLKLSKLGTDASGGGSFGTTFKFVFSRTWNTNTTHYLAARLSTACVLFSQVSVHGVNSYGGDPTTSGRVVPGITFPTLIGLEYTLTQNWVLALDIESLYARKTIFKGSTIAPVGSEWSYSLSFAPAMEYNYSANVGLIAGVWLTALGRSSANYINYVVALNWYV